MSNYIAFCRIKDKLHFRFPTTPIQNHCTIIWQLLATEHHRERAPYTLEYVKENCNSSILKAQVKKFGLLFVTAWKRLSGNAENVK